MQQDYSMNSYSEQWTGKRCRSGSTRFKFSIEASRAVTDGEFYSVENLEGFFEAGQMRIRVSFF